MTAQDQHLIHLRLESTDPAGKKVVTEGTFNALGARQVSLAINGRQALQPYDVTQVPPFATGFTMAPWANRIRDGRWTQNGATRTFAVNDTRTNTALHGLLLETVYEVRSLTPSSVEFAATITPSDGYPFRVEVTVAYQITADGFTCTQRALNLGEDPAPYGTGAHPYPYFEGVPTADLEINILANRWTKVDERLLPLASEPVSTHPVAGEAIAAGDWIRLGNLCIDNDFHDLIRGPGGVAATRLRAPSQSGDNRVLELWQDSGFSHMHVFSTPVYPQFGVPLGDFSRVQHGITIEPVTAGPDSFNTGDDLIWLQPAVEWSASWGIRLLNW